MSPPDVASEFEGLLRQALAPVEPPEDLARRLDGTLQELTDLAAEELEAWELSSIQDPRNWVRPVVAVAGGAAAGTALVALRVVQGRRKRQAAAENPLELAESTVRAVAAEARKLLDR